MRFGRWLPVAGLLGLTLVGLGSTAPGADAQQSFSFKYTDFNPPNNFITNEITRWSEEIHDKSGGRVNIDVFPSSQMGPVPRQYDLVRTGVADFGFILLGSTPGRFPLTELSQLPGLFPSAYSASVSLQENYPKYLAKEFAGVKILYLFAGPSLPLLTRKPVHTLADAKGLRIRQPDTVHARLIEALGAAPVGVDPTEVSDALNKGTIDGVIMGYSGVTAFQLDHVAKYSTEWNTGVVAFAMAMNQGSYDKLPGDIKKVIDDTTGMTGAMRGGGEFDRDDKTSRAVSGQAGVQFIESTPADTKALQAIADKVTADAVAAVDAKGLPGHAFLAALKAARDAHAHDPAPTLPTLP
ncbi:MAG TPA: TRAP transporter substrate-binding protein [Stellaceae bacterium]|nr:TRAP transporter substrate-binding protein [Stellaceae bacterium]